MRDRLTVAVLLAGDAYAREHARIFEPSVRAYCAAHGFDYVVVRDTELADANLPPGAPAAWLKPFAFRHLFQNGAQSVLLIDADVRITRNAPDIRLALAAEPGAYGRIEREIPSARLPVWYGRCAVDDSPPAMLNTGVILIDAGCAEIVEKMIAHMRDRRAAIQWQNRMYEQPLFSACLMQHPGFHELPDAFNFLVNRHRARIAPRWETFKNAVQRVTQDHPRMRKLAPSMYRVLHALPTGYAGAHRSVIQDAARHGHFLHFAGLWDERVLVETWREGDRSEVSRTA